MMNFVEAERFYKRAVSDDTSEKAQCAGSSQHGKEGWSSGCYILYLISDI